MLWDMELGIRKSEIEEYSFGFCLFCGKYSTTIALLKLCACFTLIKINFTLKKGTRWQGAKDCLSTNIASFVFSNTDCLSTCLL